MTVTVAPLFENPALSSLGAATIIQGRVWGLRLPMKGRRPVEEAHRPQDPLSQCITVKDSQAISQGHSYLESLPFDRRLPTGSPNHSPSLPACSHYSPEPHRCFFSVLMVRVRVRNRCTAHLSIMVAGPKGHRILSHSVLLLAHPPVIYQFLLYVCIQLHSLETLNARGLRRA